MVGLYGTQILPRITSLTCGTKSASALRRRVCSGLAGNIIEIGFGSGHNVPFYPSQVTGVDAIEPASVGWALAHKRVAATDVPVRLSGQDAQSLPFADDTFDAALSTWTMCTIPDVKAALREMRRVLKPGGKIG